MTHNYGYLTQHVHSIKGKLTLFHIEGTLKIFKVYFTYL